jgi:hypothetical protein
VHRSLQRVRHAQPADRLAQSPDHDAHQHQRERRLLRQPGAELLVVERDDGGWAIRHRGGGARQLRDRGHLAEDLPLGDGLDRLVADDQADFALDEQVHLVPLEEHPAVLVVLGKEPGPGGDAFALACGFEEREGDRSIVERAAEGHDRIISEGGPGTKKGPPRLGGPV